MPETFYDIHCHTMTFDHPNLIAFAYRACRALDQGAGESHNIFIQLRDSFRMLGELYDIKTHFKEYLEKLLYSGQQAGTDGGVLGSAKKVVNLIAFMEADIAGQLLYMERDLKEVAFSRQGCRETPVLTIGDHTYSQFVLTPLLIDFGDKGRACFNTHYSGINIKPIKTQTIAMLLGIRDYYRLTQWNLTNSHADQPATTTPLLRVYPFLGINPANYKDVDEINTVLNKYFPHGANTAQEITAAIQRFDGNLDQTTLPVFAGIKLYPPNGFDPWPKDNTDHKLDKTRCIYEFCCKHDIPITVHGSDGGFQTVDDDKVAILASAGKWEQVLNEFTTLRLNIAHFGHHQPAGQAESYDWMTTICKLIGEHPHVYTDFSFRGIEDCFRALHCAQQQDPSINLDAVKKKLLYGSDFMINLLQQQSYTEYTDNFITCQLPAVSAEDKHHMCSTLPEQFLWPVVKDGAFPALQSEETGAQALATQP